MSDAVITVDNVSKRYLIGHQSGRQGSYTALRDLVSQGTRDFARKTVAFARGQKLALRDDVEEFWALKNVSFEVKQGEIVGIVGRNGAGKSTLLKILSRITEPTTGGVRLRGRVASLLEVGTGFHPELTGRENVYLNGAILGMTQREIQGKFDEIVAFADVERFLDTPVKRYSSGMYLRLAFAVAAHLNPEILLIDEVLAVGDAEFQKKCLGKIEAVTANEGRTVVFISHNLPALLSLCKRGILLQGGEIAATGNMVEVIEQYYSRQEIRTSVHFEPKEGKPSITRVSMDADALKSGDLIIDVEFQSPFALNPPVPGIVVGSSLGVPIFGSNPRIHNSNYSCRAATSGVVRLEARQLPLVSGQYYISTWLGDSAKDYDHKADILSFEFHPEKASHIRPSPESIGYLEWPARWRVL